MGNEGRVLCLKQGVRAGWWGWLLPPMPEAVKEHKVPESFPLHTPHR